MADLTTYANVESELAATAGYDVDDDLSQAKRRVAALRRKLDFAESSDENGTKIEFNHAIVEKQLSQVLMFHEIKKKETLSDAEDLANPSVVHSDFSTLRGGDYC